MLGTPMLPYTFQHRLHGNGSYVRQNWSKLEHIRLPTQLVNMAPKILNSDCSLVLHEASVQRKKNAEYMSVCARARELPIGL